MTDRLEGPLQRWRRRAITIPAYLVATALVLPLLPVLLLGAWLRDLRQPASLPTVRLLLFGAWYLLCESLGILASFGIWLLGGTWLGASRERFLRWNFALQCFWARCLLAGVRTLFRLTVGVSGEECIGRGPLLVFVRHASIADTLLPAALLSSRYGFRLRYVLKRELTWDASIDLNGHRLPNVFVLRGSGDSKREIAAICDMAKGMGEDEGVLIYPEGTRHTPERLERALLRVEEAGDAERLERVRSLRHLLPVRRGGPLALLDACPDTDVLFMGHVGLEGLAKIRHILDGGLIGRHVAVRYWRAPAAEIPAESRAREAWLDGWWARLDAWIDEQKAASRA